MKRHIRVVVFLSILSSLLLLSNCKHDPPVAHTSGGQDSLYTGTPYTILVKTSTLGGGVLRSIVIPTDNPETYEGVQLGRMLFYDSTLSVNKKISCSSCHKQQYSFGDNVTLSANATNASGHTTRNAPALINLGNVGGQLSFTPYFWDGRQTTIEDAANDALTNEQKPNIPQILAYLDSTPQYSYLIKKAFGRPGNATQQIIVKALAQFIRTLVSEESRYDKLLRHEANLLNAQETRGMYIFLSQDSGDCVHCHADAPYSTFAFKPNPMRNNALDSVADYFGFADKGYGAITGDSADFGKFKIPTLRNVQVSAPYMHDGRFTTLEQVADHYGTRDSLKRSPTIDPLMERFVKPIPDLTLDQKQALVAFLNTLTDTAFLNNPNFSNPFHH